MHKKISVDDLVVGMYIKEFCGSWIDNPFWRASFVIADPKEIALIRASKIREVWIDLKKGCDAEVKPAEPADQPPPVEPTGVIEPIPTTAPPPQQPISNAPVPMADELARAAMICVQAKQAVSSMFREARMGQAVDTAGVQQLVEEISDSVARNSGALISLARLKNADDYTYMHSVAVCAMMIALARQLQLDESEVRAAGVAGLMHDIGKALVPIDILNKPGQLSTAEFAVVKRHSELGHKLLRETVSVGPMALDVCLHHHEKIDGAGYPEGLKGAAISLHAKMGAVCDVYDAITSNRPYKAGWDPAESMRHMGQWTKGHLDPVVFQAFAKSLGIYPVGSLVRLTSGRIGVVVAQSATSLIMPIVRAFCCAKSRQRIAPVVVDLSASGCGDKIGSREDPAKWNFPDLNELWAGTDQCAVMASTKREVQ